jgi:3-oxoadipate enol-lactonase
MRISRVNGVRLHHAVTGDPDGLPVVFAHALGTDLRVWDRLLPLLPAGLKLVTYDLRGHGLSDAPDGDYWMGDHVADAAGLMEALGLHDAIFVGLSLGGVVAQGLAAERPDLVRALVLCGTAAKIGTEATWRDRMAAVRAGGIEAIADGVLEKWFTRGFRASRADELAAWRHMLTRSPRDGYLGCCAALAGTDLRESTEALRQPVLAVVGADDGSTPPDLVREMAESIVGARFEILRGAGHLACVEAPEALAALIAGFIAERGLAPATTQPQG